MTVTPIRRRLDNPEGWNTDPHPDWCEMFGPGHCSNHSSDEVGTTSATGDLDASEQDPGGFYYFPGVSVRAHREGGPDEVHDPRVLVDVHWPYSVPCYEGHEFDSGDVRFTPDDAEKVIGVLRGSGSVSVMALDGHPRGGGELGVTVERVDGVVVFRIDYPTPAQGGFQAAEAAVLADAIAETVRLVTRPFQWLIPLEVYGRGVVAA